MRRNECEALGIVLRVFRENRGLSRESLGFKARLHRNYVGASNVARETPALRASCGGWILSALVGGSSETLSNGSRVASSIGRCPLHCSGSRP